jgi:HlyD family secretion protein
MTPVFEVRGLTKIYVMGEVQVRALRGIDRASAGRVLGDGYRVEARVVVWEGREVVKAPVSSLFRRGEGWAAFVEQGGVARERAIRIGHRDGTSAEILSGVSAGANVVRYPPDAVADGTPIARRQE